MTKGGPVSGAARSAFPIRDSSQWTSPGAPRGPKSTRRVGAPLLGLVCRSASYMCRPCAVSASTLPARRSQLTRRPSEDVRPTRLGRGHLAMPPPSPRPPGFSAYTVLELVSEPDSSARRLDLPFRVRRPPAARSALAPSSSHPKVSRVEHTAEPCIPRRVSGPLQRQLDESGSRRVCDTPPPSALGLSQTYDGLLLAKRCGLVSCHKHSWGSLPFKAFPSPGSRTASRRPLPSWRFPSGLPVPAEASTVDRKPRLQGVAPPEESVARAAV